MNHILPAALRRSLALLPLVAWMNHKNPISPVSGGKIGCRMEALLRHGIRCQKTGTIDPLGNVLVRMDAEGDAVFAPDFRCYFKEQLSER